MALGPLTAEQEDAIWAQTWRVEGLMAQPLTGWLLHSIGLWADRRAYSERLVKALGVTSKTWEVGLPRRFRKRQQVFENLASYIHQSQSEMMPECAERRARAMERGARALADYPTLPPCNLFHLTLGIAGGGRLEALAVALDNVSTATVHGVVQRNELPAAVVKVAENAASVLPQMLQPQPDLDPGLDALLLLMAQMDHDLTAPMMANEGKIGSLIRLLIDAPGEPKRKRVQHRLLDIYYALAFAAAGRELPERLPTVRELEDALLGGPPESGGQSLVVRWRNGTKALREEDVQSMIAHVGQATGKDLSWTFRRLYAAAQVWGRIEEHGADAVGIAGRRYIQWWNALCNQGRASTIWVQPYWSLFSAPA